MDWGTLLTRRASKKPVDQGGWSLFFTFSAGADMANPAGQLMMRGTGEKAWFGWPTDPELERLRDAWFAAPDLASQQQLARDLQSRVFETVPFVPLGQYFQPTAYRKTVHGTLNGFATFWNVTLDA
jgi:peptide/nickel transport system substrate-binding protein